MCVHVHVYGVCAMEPHINFRLLRHSDRNAPHLSVKRGQFDEALHIVIVIVNR